MLTQLLVQLDVLCNVAGGQQQNLAYMVVGCGPPPHGMVSPPTEAKKSKEANKKPGRYQSIFQRGLFAIGKLLSSELASEA